MNFFGHATVASWLDHDPRWVLGAMLPDFASMAGARLRGARDPVVSAGIALHHATDAAFHGAPIFLDLYARGTEALEAAGLGRGPARAVAHVGTELLLDGLLLDDAVTARTYAAALALPIRALGLEVRSSDGAEQLARLHERVARHGLPEDYRSPGRVALRLQQILARRPRLALSAADEPAVTPFLARTRRELVDRAPALLAEVRQGMRAFRPPARAQGLVDTLAAGHAILRGHRA